MIKTTLKKSSLVIAITTAILSSQILFAADVEVSLPDATSAFTVDQPIGTELMRVNGDGNVGIGTNTPEKILHVKNNSFSYMQRDNGTNTDARTPLYLAHTSNVDAGADGIGTRLAFGAETKTEGVIENLGYFEYITTDATAGAIDADLGIVLYRDGAAFTALFAESTGNVGIGTSTPKARLDVLTSDTTPAIFRGAAAGTSLIGNWPGVGFNTYYDVNHKSIGVGYGGSVGVDMSVGGLTFNTIDTVASADADQTVVERMRIDNIGNVGIGTPTPADRLDVNGIIRSSSNGGATQIFNESATISAINANTGARLDLRSGNATRMTVTSSGNVGIGTTTPDRLLEVNGVIEARDLNNAGVLTDGAIRIKGNTAPAPYGTIQFVNPDGTVQWNYIAANSAGNIGIGTVAPSTKLHVAGTITQDSDERLKKDITPLTSSLEKITQLQGVSFNWKDEAKYEKGIQLGLIAQEVEKIIPEVVSTSTDEQGTKSVAYTSLIAVLIEGMKEQQKRIEALEAKLK